MLHIVVWYVVTDISKCRAVIFSDKQSKVLNTNLQREWSFRTDYKLTNDPITEWIMDIIAKLVVAHLFRESSGSYEPESIWSYFVLSNWNTACTSHFLRFSNTLLSSHLALISKHVSSLRFHTNFYSPHACCTSGSSHILEFLYCRLVSTKIYRPEIF